MEEASIVIQCEPGEVEEANDDDIPECSPIGTRYHSKRETRGASSFALKMFMASDNVARLQAIL